MSNKKLFVHTRNESARMFEADWMNALSKVHWTVPLYIYIPVILFFVYQTIFSIPAEAMPAWERVAWFFAGIFIWTFFEYGVHRFIFHYNATSELGKRFHFIAHGVHHDYPQDATRLVMPPSVSIPLALIVGGVLYAIFGWLEMSPIFAGFVLGYLVYDMAHYSVHHWNWKNAYFQRIKKHHMDHHFRDPDTGFGFTSDIWDQVFDSNRKVEKK